MIERGAEPPAWMEDKPLMLEGDQFYMRSFWDLSTERQIGFTVGPIPVNSIYSYACAKGIPSSIMVLFETVIRAMDQTYLKWAEETRKKANKSSSSGAAQHLGGGKTKQAKR